MSAKAPSAPYTAVVGGKLKLKRPGAGPSAGSAIARPVVAPAAEVSAVSAAPVAGVKRKADDALAAPIADVTAGATGVGGSSDAGSAVGSAASSSAAAGGAASGVRDTRTPAQRAFDEMQSKRLKEAAKKMASKSYREKVEDLNKHLEKLPMHNDLFKIQYAGTG